MRDGAGAPSHRVLLPLLLALLVLALALFVLALALLVLTLLAAGLTLLLVLFLVLLIGHFPTPLIGADARFDNRSKTLGVPKSAIRLSGQTIWSGCVWVPGGAASTS